MKKTFLFLIALICAYHSYSQNISQEERMKWWRDARFGLFIHWGLYAIPAGEWKGKPSTGLGEWIMKRSTIPVAEYEQLAKQFNPVKFDAKKFVAIAKDAGMKYIAITSKHHDGFAMFKSHASKYNVVDATPYGKDIIKALADECHKQGIKICFYYSQSRDWHEPNGLDNDWDFPAQRNFQQYLDEKVKPQLTELLTQYGEIGMIWFDTPMTITKEQAQSLKDLVRRLQPRCIISGRLGGGVETDYKSTGDNSIPAAVIREDWEVPATLNNTWGFRKDDHHWKSPEDITRLLFDIASKGGNYLLNVGPTAEGVIPEESVNILSQVGKWMKINHEAIYGTKASPFNPEFAWGNITTKPGKLYLGIYQWPQTGFYLEGIKNKINKVYLLSDPSKRPIAFKETYDRVNDHHLLKINLPANAPDKVVSVVVVEIQGNADAEKTITQQQDRTVKLPGVDAKIYKGDSAAKLNFISRAGGAEGWVDPAVNLDWQFKVIQPGTYKVDIITTETGSTENPSWQGDHVVKIISGNQSFETKIVPDSKEYNQRSQYWKKIHTNGGTVTFDKPGIYHLTLAPVKFSEGKTGFTFREIHLLPAY
ncbi:MAG: Alpha-L-fucosidase [Bacteroidota bacterium]|nr:Alpha-L-fucosidase [Bacteroidota bacterium]